MKVFRTKKDREDFLGRVASLWSEGAFAVYAWALMDTHFHLLVRTLGQPLSSSMRQLLTGFVVNFNKRHKRYGHLFQNRYKSIICEDDPYLLELTRYIHLNPIRAGAIKTMDELDSYAWTGHGNVVGTADRPWQDRDAVLSYFGKTEKTAIRKYRRFIEAGIGTETDLSGGGLRRSAGGLLDVASLRKNPMLSDERILGSGAFVQSVLADSERASGLASDLRSSLPDLPSLAKLVARKEKVDIALLLSGSRKRSIARARRIFCRIAVKKLRYSGASVARFLGLSTSLVNRMAAEDGENDLDGYLK